MTTTNKTAQLYAKAKELIPGGTQLLSKRPEMFLPDQWPAYYDRAKGCELWDLDGNHYVDMSYMGIGTCTIGYADDEIDSAVLKGITRGNMSTLNPPEEVELAEELLRLHPWAQMARFARTGGEAVSIAIRIARAFSNRDVVLFGGYHGWSDWYLAANLEDESNLDHVHLAGLNPAGVASALKGTAYPFFYNDSESFVQLVRRHRGRIGAVIIESIRNLDPDPDFVSTLNQVTRDEGIPFIVDEISAGFRMVLGGGHLLYGIQPDIAVFAKGMSNGYPMSAIIGKRDIMDMAQESFISSTYWTERSGPIAALATITKMRREKIPTYLVEISQSMRTIWRAAAEKYGISIRIAGMPAIPTFSFVGYEEPLVIKTLFTQVMLSKGFLASTSFYASFAHRQEHLDSYAESLDDTFKILSLAASPKKLRDLLDGPVCHSGFRRLTG